MVGCRFVGLVLFNGQLRLVPVVGHLSFEILRLVVGPVLFVRRKVVDLVLFEDQHRLVLVVGHSRY